MNANALATLPDLDEIEDGFNRAMALYEEAFAKIADADAAIKAAHGAIAAVTPGATYHEPRDAREVSEFNEAVKLPDRALYLRVARKLANIRCWEYVVDRCGMGHLMDAQAKKELDAQLRYVPERVERRGEIITEAEAAKGMPPFTAAHARATLATFAGDAHLIWRRGIANAFSGLDRRFRSHDGFKIGSRVILNYFANNWGSIDSHGSRADTFRDIERTFHILDGRDPRHTRSGMLYQIQQERNGGRGRTALDGWQSEHDGEYFKVRVFKNGNAHLWFTRDDLLDLVNKELAAHYGEVIGDGNTKEADPLESRALTPARLFGFYPTPPALAATIAKKVPYSERALRILEPSAGTGNIAAALLTPREIWDCGKVVGKIKNRVDCVEIQPDLAAGLRASGKYARVTTADFITLQPPSSPADLYDGVVMNPPFDMERDIDHVSHALKFLKADGFLLAIMSAGVEFRETKKAAAFRKLVDVRKGWIVDLPAGSFASVGTHVNTVLVGIGLDRKPWRYDD